jgi:hypothetical protein
MDGAVRGEQRQADRVGACALVRDVAVAFPDIFPAGARLPGAGGGMQAMVKRQGATKLHPQRSFHPGFALVAEVHLTVGAAHCAKAHRTTERRSIRRTGRVHRGGRCGWLLRMMSLRSQGDRRRQTKNSKADKNCFVHARTPLGREQVPPQLFRTVLVPLVRKGGRPA